MVNNRLNIGMLITGLIISGPMNAMMRDVVRIDDINRAPKITLQEGGNLKFPGYGMPMLVNGRVLVLYDLDDINANKDISKDPAASGRIKSELLIAKKRDPESHQVLFVFAGGPNEFQIVMKVNMRHKGLEATVPKALYDQIFMK